MAADGTGGRHGRGPVLRDRGGVVQGRVPRREARKGAHLGRQGAGRGNVQDHLVERRGQEDLDREADPGLVPIPETATETKDGRGDQGVGHMIDHVIVGARGPDRDQRKEDGATDLVPVRVTAIVTVDNLPCMKTTAAVNLWSGNRLTVVVC